MDEDENSFKFNFQQFYNGDVEEFVYKTKAANLPHHCIQDRSTSFKLEAVCLLCRNILPVPVTPSAVALHTNSKDHYEYGDEIAFDAYHTCFLLFTSSEDQLRQLNFKPHSSSQVFCDNCKECIAFDDVLQHDKACGSSCWKQPPDAVNMNSKLHIRPGKQKIPDDLSFQAMGPLYTCLVCRLASIKSIRDHLNSGAHKFSIEAANPAVYEQFSLFWKSQSADICKYKTHFVPVNMRQVKCLLCSNNVSYKSVKEKIKTLPCMLLSPDHPLYDADLQEKFHLNFNKFSSAMPSMLEFYPPLLQKLTEAECRVSFPILQRQPDSTVKCLVCMELILAGNVEEHLSFPPHKENAADCVKLSAVANYHLFWKSQPSSAQEIQLQFYPSSTRHFQCSFCKAAVLKANVVKHASRCKTSKNVRLTASDVEVTEEQTTNHPTHDLPALHNCTTIEENAHINNSSPKRKSVIDLECQMPILSTDIAQKFYPLHNGNNIKVLQTTEHGDIYCLCCGTSVPDDHITHISNEEHLRNWNNEKVMRNVLEYHKFWDTQKDIQLQQTNYAPSSIATVECRMCKQQVKYTDIRVHNGMHLDVVNGDHTASFPDEIQTVEAGKYDCLSCRKVVTSPLNHIQTIRHKNALALSSSAVQSYHTYWSLRKKAERKDQFNYYPSSAQCARCKVCRNQVPYSTMRTHACFPKGIEPADDNYSKAVLKRLFPGSQPNEPLKMYFLQRQPLGRACLYCGSSLQVNFIEAHIKGKKHLKNYTNRQKVEHIEAYHKYWLTFPIQTQMKQVHWFPHDENSMFCTYCSEVMEFASVDVATHRCYLTERIEHNAENGAIEVPQECVRIKLGGSKAVKRRLYPYAFMNVTETAVVTNMPLGRVYGSHITCLLCGMVIQRSNNCQYWLLHLKEQHRNTAEQKFKILLAYHKFWEAQPVEVQFLQVQFIPISENKFRCVKNHSVPHSDVITHSKECLSKDAIKLCELVCTSISSDQQTNSEAAEATTSMAKPVTKPQKKSNIYGVEHKVEPAINNTTGDLLDNLPNRLKVNKKHLVVNAKGVKCTPCNSSLPKNVDDIWHHLAQDVHLQNAKIVMGYHYVCEICYWTGKSEREWLTHNDTVAHKHKCDRLPATRVKSLGYYECTTCDTALFGDNISIVRHKQAFAKDKKRDTAKNNNTIPLSLKTSFESVQAVNGEVKKLLSDAQKMCTKQRIDDCISALERALEPTYPDCKCYPLGSKVTGITTDGSDLDVYMDIGGMYTGTKMQDPVAQQKIVLAVKKILDKDSSIFFDILPIVSARTPIVKVIHVPTDTDCDISFKHGLSVENTKYITFCVDLMPAAKNALLMIKFWSGSLKLNEEINSYAMSLMFVFYLQVKGFILPVAKLRLLTTMDVQIIEGWETITYNKSIDFLKQHVKAYDGTVFDLLLNFFDFYSKFNYREEVVCPLLGRTVRKEYFMEQKVETCLPDEMTTYKVCVRENPNTTFRITSPICVQDPFDLVHNVTKAVPKKLLDSFKKYCDIMVAHMTKKR